MYPVMTGVGRYW